jgi:diaminopimelate epimerase
MTRLSKHEALGNDFLVLDTAQPLVRLAWGALAQRWCDRRRGVGADGLLSLTIDPADPSHLTMVLHNADGSRAEMSGNGIRCLAQAAFRSQGHDRPVTYRVSTDAGERTVEVTPVSADEIEASVDMGSVDPIDEPAGWAAIGAHPDRPVAHLSLGNPHTVVGVDQVAVVDLALLGGQVPDVNLEIVEPGPEPYGITMRVHERGAGITEACGTGACASAVAAARWGLVPATAPEIVVHMDGGDAKVRLDTPTPGTVTLVGPARFVADIDITP